MRKSILAFVLSFALFSAPLFAQNNAGAGANAWDLNTSQYVNLGTIASGPTTTSSVTYTLYSGTITLPNGRTMVPYSTSNPVTIVDANTETDTPSAVSGCAINGAPNTCQITFSSVTSSHGQGAKLVSGTGGLYEAALDANSFANGGSVVVAPSFSGTAANITAGRALYANVAIIDARGTFLPPIFIVGSCAGTPTTASTLYFGFSYATTVCTGYTTATEPTLYAPRTGTLRNLKCTSTVAGQASDGATTVWVAPLSTGTLAASAITATIGTGTTASDTTHTANVVAGQIIQIRQVEAGSSSINSPVCTLQLF